MKMYNRIFFAFVNMFILYLSVTSGYINAQQLQGKAIAPLSLKNMKEMKVIDSGNIRIMYAFNAEDITNPDTYIDLHRLEIGACYSKYYSYFVFKNDSLVWAWREKNPNAHSYNRWLGLSNRMKSYWSEYKYSEYFKDYKKDVLTEYARMPHGVKTNRVYSESSPKQCWEIQNETLIVNGYLCQKATCDFRGRKYIAWFTRDIPISNGPWKFGGLPGLILKIYDDKHLYTFECVTVENMKYLIKKYEFEDYVPIKRLELLELQRNLNENYYKTVGARSRDGKELPGAVLYEPLELE